MRNIYNTLKSLFPNGWAFRIFNNSVYKDLLTGLSEEPDRIRDNADDVRDAGIPGTIPADGLADWETFYGLRSYATITDQQRQDRIIGRTSAVGGQGPGYIEQVLHDNGYTDCFVFENTVPVDPAGVSGTLIGGAPTYSSYKHYIATLGNTNLGERNLGGYSGSPIVEHQPTVTAAPATWPFYWFIMGPLGIGDPADIPTELEDDFFRLLYQLKPLNTWVIANINFT